jgi:putative addiction module killer protein
MEIREIQIETYETKDGRCPFDEWYEALKDKKAKARIRARINRLRFGNFGDCRSVGQGVSELRIHFGPGYRVYFGQAGATLVVLLCGGDKSSQKQDIRKAQQYWKEYQEENAH